MNRLDILQTEIVQLEAQLEVACQQRAKLRHPESIYDYNQQCKRIDVLREALRCKCHERDTLNSPYLKPII